MLNSSKQRTNVEVVDTVYDMHSSDASLNWGYTSGMHGQDGKTGLSLSKYKYLRVYVQLYNVTNMGVSVVYTIDLQTPSDTLGSYVGSCRTRANNISNDDGWFSISVVNSQRTSFTHVQCGYGRTAENTKSIVSRVEGIRGGHRKLSFLHRIFHRGGAVCWKLVNKPQTTQTKH